MWWPSIVDALIVAALGMLLGALVDWVSSRAWELRFLIESTIFMRRVRAEARSRTPGGSTTTSRAVRPTPSRGPLGETRTPALSPSPPAPSLVDADTRHGPASTRDPRPRRARPGLTPASAEANERRPVGKAGRRGTEVETACGEAGSLGPRPNSVGGGASAPAVSPPTRPYLTH